ncbi:MAG: GLUG motif-containing protein [Rikenellaceae bacterium]
MKNIFNYFTLAAAAVVGLVSCEISFEDNNDILASGNTTTLYASTPSQTRVSFAEDDASNINLTWEVEDEFTLYDTDGEYVGQFSCTDAATGRFESDDAVLSNGESYTAKYNEQEDISSQNGDAISQLDEACQMVATFTYGDDASIEFSHTMAVMTFTFTSTDRPAKLIFDNGTVSYTVTYSDIAPVNGYYTSHIMIHPCDATERTLSFSLLDGEGTAYDIRTVTTTKEYEAGVRYTSPVSQLAPTIMLGSGTEADPYQIATTTQLRDIATAVNDGTTTYEGEHFVMMNNIDLKGEEFTAIGTENKPFSGTFDGGGYEVSGLYINKYGSVYYNYQALFGYISGATIQNLDVSGSVTIEASSWLEYIGGVVGYATSSTISNCYSNVAVTTSAPDSNSNIGGIVGYAKNVSITNCYNLADISGSGSYIGGIMGYTYNATTTNCYNLATISGVKNIGGIIGYGTYGSSVINSYNTAAIEGSENVGGAVGYFSQSTSTINSYNTGAVKGSSYVGGVVGRLQNATATNCYNSATVEGSSNIGGVIGYASYYTITNCYYNNTAFTATTSYGSGYASSYMQSTNFAKELNNNAYAYNSENTSATQTCAWAAVANSYPTLDYTATPSYSELETPDPDIVLNDGVYEIYNAAGMQAFADLVNGESNTSRAITSGDGFATFEVVNREISGKLMDDITLEERAWSPIGSSSSMFKGSLDGDGLTIYGLQIDSQSEGQSLFGYISGATIENLTVEGAISGTTYVGGIVAYASSSTINNCHNKVVVVGTTKYIGGIAGDANSTTIINCSNSATVTGGESSTYIGGIAGRAATTVNCYNSAKVSGGSYVGGVSGSATTMDNCYNSAEVAGSSDVGGATGSTLTDLTNTYYNRDAYLSLTSRSNDDNMFSSNMRSESFVTLMNNGASSYNSSLSNSSAQTAYGWSQVDNNFPTIDKEATPATKDLLTAVGAGTESSPYLIQMGLQLRELSTVVDGGESFAGKYFKMDQNIDLGGVTGAGESNTYYTFNPIGYSDTDGSRTFSGNFDGGEFTISGLYINSLSEDSQGIFATIDGATIQNVTISGYTIKGASYVGSVVGYATNSTITNCHSEVTSIYGGDNYIGGVVGAIDNSTISNCSNSSTINGACSSLESIGGVVGFVRGSTASGCYNSGTIYNTGNCGGVVGRSELSASTISDCYNSGTVSSSLNYAGGIIGSINTVASTVSYCYNVGTLSSKSGDIAGYAAGVSSSDNCIINNCYYTSSSTGSSVYCTETNVEHMTTIQMQEESFVTTLNDGRESAPWRVNIGGYPMLTWQ